MGAGMCRAQQKNIGSRRWQAAPRTIILKAGKVCFLLTSHTDFNWSTTHRDGEEGALHAKKPRKMKGITSLSPPGWRYNKHKHATQAQRDSALLLRTLSRRTSAAETQCYPQL